jgi:hypothetical protein
MAIAFLALVSIAAADDSQPPAIGSFERPICIVADFNNDGLPDLAVADGALAGNVGANWSIYLRTKAGSYHWIGDVLFHGKAFAIEPLKPGVGKLLVYIRAGLTKGALVEYAVSQAGIKELRETTMYPQDADSDRYQKLFGHLYEKDAVQTFDPASFKIKGKTLTPADPGGATVAPQYITVEGTELRAPAKETFKPSMTLSEALVRAGGFDGIPNVFIIRGNERTRIRMKPIIMQQAHDPVLQPGDHVEVNQGKFLF